MHNTEFKPMLSSFLLDYLPDRRGYSENTVANYRDAFVLLLRYAQSEGIAADDVEFEILDKRFVEGFLAWLGGERGCSPQTRNNRLAALKSFFRFVQMEAPERMAQASEVLSIKATKTPEPDISYLSLDGVSALLDAASTKGLRDLAMLSLLYDSGARVQELADARVCDIRLDPPRTLKITGKGGKTRVVPITEQVGNIVEAYLTESETAGTAHLFANRRGEPIGRAGIAYVLRKHIARAHATRPECVPPTCTPHALRHSKAMHMLEAGVNLVYIRDFLGHASITTTEMYARANPEMKRAAVETLRNRIGAQDVYSDAKKDELISWLRLII